MKILDPKKLPIKDIKYIIFDWGGVIININYDATVHAFGQLGYEKFEEYYHQRSQHALFDDYEIGSISTNVFRDGIRKALSLPDLSNQQIDEAWSAMLLDMPMERIEIIKKLKTQYRLFLLSNTNQIHEDEIVPRLDNQLGYPFFSLFDAVYLSHRVGERKPNAAIFEHVMRENNLNPKETLFIDDSEQHIDGASALGINAFYLQKGMSIVDIFKYWF